MVFNSFIFAAFFLLVISLYFLAPRIRLIMLLVASYIFYASWNPKYLILIVASTLIDYFAAIRMSHCKTQSSKKRYLYLSIVVNLGLLFIFKYYDFVCDTLWQIFNQTGQFPFLLDMVLPVGISFYTFQTLSYSIDVYNDKCPAEKNLIRFAVFVSFFPQLIIGPIERARHLIPQFYENHRCDVERVKAGCILIAKGLFKKMVIADKIAITMLPAFTEPMHYSPYSLLLTSYATGIMIYADFSGYTDIARGCASIMGFRLVENFKQPFFASNLSQFWSRWHISMTSWFQSYLFWPLSNRFSHSKFHVYLLTLFVFSMIGLWHGAKWNCVLWGGGCGALIIIGNLTRRQRTKVYRSVCAGLAGGQASGPFYNVLWEIHHRGAILTTLTFFCMTTPLFLSASVSDAISIYERMMTGLFSTAPTLNFKPYEFSLIVGAIVILFIMDFFDSQKSIISFGKIRPVIVRYAIYSCVLMAILMFGEFGQREFFYFQFFYQQTDFNHSKVSKKINSLSIKIFYIEKKENH